ncbi:MAG: hypothetical protein ACE5KM_09220 [Planctomycetaceae bacterium]
MPNRRAIDKTFSVEYGRLVRTVTLADGRSYTHRCELEAYRAVAWFVAEHAAEGVTTNMLWNELADVSCTQAALALDFLKERGCVVTRLRRNFPASDVLYEDALIEFHALEANA